MAPRPPSPRRMLIKLVLGWIVTTTLLAFFAAFAWRHHLGLVSSIFWTVLALWVGLSFPWRNRAALRLLFRLRFGGIRPIALKTDAGGRSVFECPGCGRDVPVNTPPDDSHCPKCGTVFGLVPGAGIAEQHSSPAR